MNILEVEKIVSDYASDNSTPELSASKIIELVNGSGWLALKKSGAIKYYYTDGEEEDYYLIRNYHPNHFAILRNDEFSNYPAFEEKLGKVYIYHIKNEWGLYRVYDCEHHSYDTAQYGKVYYYGHFNDINEWLEKCTQSNQIIVKEDLR